jgi:putative ABC transport system permease protein
MRLLAGREIRDADTAASPFVAVVNETFARTFVPGGSPVGRRFRVDESPGFPEQAYEIVGLVADAKYRVLRDGPRPVAFIALAQRGGSNSGGIYLVRSVTTPQAFNAALREALARVHPNRRFSVRSLEGVVREATLRGTIAMAVGALAIVALIASLMPAQRAARVDPMSTLKDE